MSIALTQTFTKPCAGQCRGDLTVVLDGDSAYATTDTYGDSGFVSQDAVYVTYLTATGEVEVLCGAIHTQSDERCDETLVIPASEVRGPRQTRSPLARHATPMEIVR